MYTEILPIIFYLFLRRKFSGKSLWVIFFLPTISFLNNIYSLYLRYYEHRSNFLFYNIEQLIETILLYYFFYLTIKNTVARKTIFFFSILYLILWIFSFYQFRDTKYFSSCTTFENMTVLALIIYYYYEQIIIINSAFIYAESTFWIVTAFFIYISGTFFLYLFISSFNLIEQRKYYDLLNSIFTIIRTLLISVAIFIQPDFTKTNRSNLIKREGLYK